MVVLLIVLHVIVGIFLIAVVLLQTGKAGNIADVFGGGGSMAAFGARGAATVLSRVTTVAAILFMITSLSLSLVKTRESSLMSNQPTKQSAPAKPAQPQPPKK
ncbi:MAG TPA: preprotein translocase subunit SecG [Acidobacteriota bacterium]|nr:preprotein translocase subunit SecG [Acidobacteriota bacterium]